MDSINKLIIVVFLPALLASCATNSSVSVVSAEPQNCAYLKTVSAPQCSAGLQAHAGTTEKTLKALKSEAINAGGNTIECCDIDKEETIIAGMNSKTGKISCIGVVLHSANVYRCKSYSQ